MTVDDMRAEARRLFDVAVAAADPGPAVDRWLASHWTGTTGRLVVLGLGKAAPAMVRAALARLAPDRALCVTNPENDTRIDGAEVILGAHPVPDAGSARAGAALLEAVAGLSPEDRVLVLVSGGGSALAVAPVDGVSFDDKAQVSRLLLGAGLDINRMNLVRQNLSLLKGGGLARAAAPAQVTALVLSDVIGDDLSIIASGPTVAPAGGAGAAMAVLRGAGLWDAVPGTVRTALEQAPAVDAPDAQTHLIGSNRVSLEAMMDARDGAVIVDDALTGDVEDAAAGVLAAARTARSPATLLFGGETTVRLRGSGRGGRNQELALRVALSAGGLTRPWVFLSGGTDGRDGPTEAAGGIVDGTTTERLRAAGVDAEALLANNDSNAALAAAGDLLVTGGTGTNVADVQVMILA